MTHPVFIVDSFTDEAFRGNAAGVVLLQGEKSEEWMQSVATEINLSETAFVDISGDEAEPKPLRWFTPGVEVDLCGHATLATAHVLGGTQRFATKSGELICTALGDGWIEMDFPTDPPIAYDDARIAENVLPGTSIDFTRRGVSDVLVAVPTADDVRKVEPDLRALLEIPVRGLIVTAPGDTDGIDFVSRWFGPAVGVPEDPVTGSAHCTLAAYWSERLGSTSLAGEQLSKRGGIVRVEVRGDRVALRGQAVSVLSGELAV